MKERSQLFIGSKKILKCGIRLEDFQDVANGDILEFYEER